ncbi:Prolyl 4-hydroxylase, alpha polypeptide [Bulinus truncatus]|nr:Prolyl 4-hydroxylase, alpha polypeptide [Bulinus truncatus]
MLAMDKRFVFLLVCVTALVHLTSEELFTSFLKMERILKEEEDILREIDPFVDRQFDRLKKMNKLITDRSFDVGSRAETAQELSHPNAAYNVIRDFVTHYTDALGDNFNVFLEKNPDLLLANESDYTGAVESLVRLKRIYKLNITDMIKGDYLGFQGPSHPAFDVIEMYSNKTVRHIDQDEVVDKLCRHELTSNVTFTNTPQIVCRYREALIPYYRFKEELLSIQPFVSVIYDFVSDRESEHFISVAKDNLERGLVYNLDGTDGITVGRTGQVGWIDDFQSDVARNISLRIQHLTGLITSNILRYGPKNGESFQIVNYGISGHYTFHYDAVEDTRDLTFLDRVATFLIYLNDVDKGGSTVFRDIQLSVTPRKRQPLMLLPRTQNGHI